MLKQIRADIRQLGNPLKFKLNGSIYANQLKLNLTRAYDQIVEQKNYNEYTDSFIDRKVTKDDLPAVIIDAILSGKKYYLEIANRVINLNTKLANPDKLLALYRSFLGDVEFKYAEGSDTLSEIATIAAEQNPFLRMIPEPIEFAPEKDGERFYYHNTTCLDLTKYQIYPRNVEPSPEHCFVYALKECGIATGKLNGVTAAINGPLQKAHLNKFTQIIKKNIHIHYFNNRNQEREDAYGDYKDSLHIALFENHYFVYERLPHITTFASKNYRRVIEYKKNPFKITKINKTGPRRGTDKKPISSLSLVRNLMDQKLFEPAPRLTKSQKKKMVNYFDNILSEQRYFEQKVELSPKYPTFYGDCETDVSNGNHKLFLAGIVDEKNESAFISHNVTDIFDYIRDRTRINSTSVLYFHNLRYDWAIIGAKLFVLKSCERNNTMYTVTVRYKQRTIILKDSYKLITAPLSKFNKMFGLDIAKAEAINYRAYTIGMDERMGIKEYAQGLKVKDLPIFEEALRNNPEFESDGHTFNAVKYYKYYLNLDCLVLRAGMQEMNKAVMALTDNQLNAFSINTAASLAHKYATLNGAYDGVCEVKGSLRKYLAEAVYGGRVCVNQKYKKQVIQGPIADYDGVSLYPSAMSRLSQETGIAKGHCEHFKDKIPVDADYYVCTIKLLAINKKQDNPFIAIRSDGELNYVNEIKEPVELIIDRYTLEDYVKFHHIEYQMIEGVYWNQGFNNKIGEVINSLFQARLVYKKEKKESLQLTVKLIMNSMYGKTIMKSCDEDVVYKPTKNALNFIRKNFNTISSYTRTDNWCRIQISKPDLSYNLAHVGISILSISKRIMNEVMSTASDNNLPIYYQDTDSMHMRLDDVATLERLYEQEYKRVLTGKQLGQFHVDFSLGNCKDVYATESIFLGKKCYIDKLIGDGKVEGTHIRMKGIPNDSIQHKAKQLKLSAFQLYEKLAKGVAIEFNLNFDEHHVNFEFSNGGVSTRDTGSFNRLIQF